MLCSVKCAHNVLGHAPPPPSRYPTPRKQLCSQSQITFYTILKLLLLSPNNSVAAVTLENKALLFYVFIVFATP